MHLLRTLAICGLAVASTASIHAQNHLLEKVRLNDATTSKGITIDKPSGLATGQILNFPSSAGAVDQVLGITNVTGTSIDMGWTSAGAATTTTSNRVLAVQTVTYGGAGSGPSVLASANTNYRVTGVIRGKRINTGGSPSDNLVVKLTGPAGTTYTMIAVRCTGCPDGTTGVPLVAPGTTTATTAAFNPAGGTADFTAVTLCFEGLIKVGGTAANVSVSLVDDGARSNGTEILTDSYLLLTEVE
jgi:hypothetical protein